MPNKLTRYAWLSIATALATIVLKAIAYYVTGSVGLLSDAVESIVNLVGGIMALSMLTIAAQPADDDHAFGHSKAEYFSSGVEGSLILLAAVSIAWTAIPRLFHPKPLEAVGVGLLVSLAASAINLVVALGILRAGRNANSITLQANAKHLLTDVWTSVGVLAAVGLVYYTGWLWLDPLIALLVAANIVWTGYGIVSESVGGLMDRALDPAERKRLADTLEPYRQDGIDFHAVITRRAGARKFVSMHVLVPGDWSVQKGHELLERIEADIRRSLPHSIVFTHLEPKDDPASFEDEKLERI